MKFLVFNIVVLLSLGYLITGQKNSTKQIIKAFEDLKKDKELNKIKSKFTK